MTILLIPDEDGTPCLKWQQEEEHTFYLCNLSNDISRLVQGGKETFSYVDG
jgi:hypothetical protein